MSDSPFDFQTQTYLRFLFVFQLRQPFYMSSTDPYLRLELNQPARAEVREQTKRRKKTSHAVYNELFLFPISPRITDLNYTSLTLTLFDHVAIAGDDVMGQVSKGAFRHAQIQDSAEEQLGLGPGINLVTILNFVLSGIASSPGFWSGNSDLESSKLESCICWSTHQFWILVGFWLDFGHHKSWIWMNGSIGLD